MKDNLVKHLEFIQNIITRMNTNSFQIKGLSITIVSAIFAIYVSTHNQIIIFISLLPILLFWFLDAYYLLQERKFRALYNEVIDNVKLKPFEMNISKYIKGEFSYWNVLVSKTILPFYLFILLLSLSMFLLTK